MGAKKTSVALSARSLGAAIDAIEKLQEKEDALEAQLSALRKKILGEKNKVLKRFKKSTLHGARGRFGVASVIERDIPQVKDFDKVMKYVIKRKAFELLQKRVSAEAWRERVEANDIVPGIEAYKDVKLRVVKSKKRA